MVESNSRPSLTKAITANDFRDFYWLKEELVSFCKIEGLAVTGSKLDISQRIETYLMTDLKPTVKQAGNKPRSTFDWQNEPLTLETIITDNYKNSENVRVFFENQLGKSFKFNVKFMNWMKKNAGKTLENAILEWSRLKALEKSNKGPKEIAPQFEYNRYLRDFMADNPLATRAEGIKRWKLNKSMRGDNIYKKEDLLLLPK